MILKLIDIFILLINYFDIKIWWIGQIDHRLAISTAHHVFMDKIIFGCDQFINNNRTRNSHNPCGWRKIKHRVTHSHERFLHFTVWYFLSLWMRARKNEINRNDIENIWFALLSFTFFLALSPSLSLCIACRKRFFGRCVNKMASLLHVEANLVFCLNF